MLVMRAMNTPHDCPNAKAPVMPIDYRFTAAVIIAAYAVVAALERFSGRRFVEAPFFRPYFGTDVAWYFAAAAVTIWFGPLLEKLATVRAEAGLPGIESFNLPMAASVVLATVIYDFAATMCHMILHRFDFLWSVHKVHHSSRHLDWLATTRAHVLEHLFRGVPTQGALFVLGFPFEAVAIALAVYGAFAVLGHSNLKLDLVFAEGLLVTPRLHRLHHIPASTQRNFGTVLTLWDRILGCFLAADSDASDPLGVPGEADTYPQSWGAQLLRPFHRG